MEQTNKFKFAVLFFDENGTAPSFKGDFVTDEPVKVLKHSAGENCYAYINKHITLLLPASTLNHEDIIGNQYTVSDESKVHTVIVVISDGNTVTIPAQLPTGKKFTHIEAANFYSLCEGGLFLCTEVIGQ